MTDLVTADNLRIGEGKAGPGRPKGTPNKVTAAAKEAFALAFNGIGGVPALIEWAKENQTEFFKLYARLIPVEQQIAGKDGGPIEMKSTYEFVDAAAAARSVSP